MYIAKKKTHLHVVQRSSDTHTKYICV